MLMHLDPARISGIDLERRWKTAKNALCTVALAANHPLVQNRSAVF
jgi:hypothetical protein